MVDEVSEGVQHFHWIVLCVLKNYLLSRLVAVVFVFVDWPSIVEPVLVVVIPVEVIPVELVAVIAIVAVVVPLVVILSEFWSVASRGDL